MEHPGQHNEVHIRQANADDIPFIRSLSERFASVGTPTWRDPAKMQQFHQHTVDEASSAITLPVSLVMIAKARDGTRLGCIFTDPLLFLSKCLSLRIEEVIYCPTSL